MKPWKKGAILGTIAIFLLVIPSVFSITKLPINEVPSDFTENSMDSNWELREYSYDETIIVGSDGESGIIIIKDGDEIKHFFRSEKVPNLVKDINTAASAGFLIFAGSKGETSEGGLIYSVSDFSLWKYHEGVIYEVETHFPTSNDFQLSQYNFENIRCLAGPCFVSFTIENEKETELLIGVYESHKAAGEGEFKVFQLQGSNQVNNILHSTTTESGQPGPEKWIIEGDKGTYIYGGSSVTKKIERTKYDLIFSKFGLILLLIFLAVFILRRNYGFTFGMDRISRKKKIMIIGGIWGLMSVIFLVGSGGLPGSTARPTNFSLLGHLFAIPGYIGLLLSMIIYAFTPRAVGMIFVPLLFILPILTGALIAVGVARLFGRWKEK